MKKTIILLLAILATLAACQKVDVPVYNAEQPSLNFVKSYFTPGLNLPDYDTLKVNTVYYAGLDEVDYKIPVHLSGAVTDHDRKYTVRILQEKSYGDLIENIHYSLPAEQTFHAGQYADSTLLRVKLAKLREDRVVGTLVIELVPDETFIAGLDTYQSIGVELSGAGFTYEPSFWSRNKLNDYGGTYSSIKAEKYVELNGVVSDMWIGPSALLYAYGKRTYEWFRDNPTYDNGVRVEFKGTINYE